VKNFFPGPKIKLKSACWFFSSRTARRHETPRSDLSLSPNLQVRSNVILCPDSGAIVGELHSPNVRTGAYATERRNSAKKDLFGVD